MGVALLNFPIIILAGVAENPYCSAKPNFSVGSNLTLKINIGQFANLTRFQGWLNLMQPLESTPYFWFRVTDDLNMNSFDVIPISKSQMTIAAFTRGFELTSGCILRICQTK